MPFFPLINDGNALVQPIYAADLAKAVMSIIRVSDPPYNLLSSSQFLPYSLSYSMSLPSPSLSFTYLI
jgi:hypothetical protein